MKCWLCGYGGLSYGPNPAVAWVLVQPSMNTIRLCQTDLDHWFNSADEDECNEPVSWGWIGGRAPVAA